MSKKRPPLNDLIAKTPGAQTRQAARANAQGRRTAVRDARAQPEPDIAAKEPVSDDMTQTFARDFFKRLKDEARPPKGGTPTLIVDNDNTGPDDAS